MRFSIKGHGQQRFGLGTDDLEEARAIAAAKYQEAVFKAKHQILEGKTSFNKIAEQYVEALVKETEKKPERAAAARYAERIVRRYLGPYFERKTINSIGVPQLYAYKDWRVDYWVSGAGANETSYKYERGGKQVTTKLVTGREPSISTLKREATVLRGIFKFAVRKGYIKSGDIPEFDFGKTVKKKRPAFTKDQINKLLSVSEKRILEAANDLSFDISIICCTSL